MTNNILIILTPFQAVQYKNLIDHNLIEGDLYIFISKYVDEQYLFEIIPNDQIVEIHHIYEEDILLKKLIAKPLSEYKKVRTILKKYKEQIVLFLNSNSGISFNIFSGSDKSIFDQLFYHYVLKFNQKLEIILVEEGIGYYKENTFEHRIFNLIYSALTPIIFGVSLNYVYALGNDKRADKVYVRRLDLIKKSNNLNKLIEIPKSNLRSQGNVKNHFNTVLLLTSPLSEQKKISEQKESEIITKIIDLLLKIKNQFILNHIQEKFLQNIMILLM
ncbi:hypothetical protein MY04_2864 [Flammeovirga sp. MY04]|uniref:polysialyltransferase family glycosyltransferase n=1 Tax=Flammeovirga sp. MY04 TaxID=1191459 RepID=UPI00080613F1|nr:polysialyltransferase family glycosyltransferase [Flammeovirga sp. MY04]ANQ50232.1 hypothetical protein MY04_2864 [Flammeovirga sp. MY04]